MPFGWVVGFFITLRVNLELFIVVLWEKYGLPLKAVLFVKWWGLAGYACLRAALDGEGAEDAGDDGGDEFEDFSHVSPIYFNHNEYVLVVEY